MRTGNDRPAARHGFARAAELYLASDMPVHAACVQRRLATLGDTMRDLHVREPSLEDVFFGYRN